MLGAPAPGLYSGAPVRGTGLVPGSAAGVLRILGRAHDLLVPDGASGRVAEVAVRDLASPVEYGERLLVLVSRGLDAAENTPAQRVSPYAISAARRPADGVAEGDYALRAPTAGIFYARPDPASEPYATVGGTLAAGQTAGLIEVMKVFSPIVHPGGTIPSPARVSEMRVREGDEVRPGQILFILRVP